MAELGMALLRQLTAELGYGPATTDPEDIERHRRLNAALDTAPDLNKTAKKFAHLHKPVEQKVGDSGPCPGGDLAEHLAGETVLDGESSGA